MVLSRECSQILNNKGGTRRTKESSESIVYNQSMWNDYSNATVVGFHSESLALYLNDSDSEFRAESKASKADFIQYVNNLKQKKVNGNPKK